MLGEAAVTDAGHQVSEAYGIDRLLRAAQVGNGPPLVFADVVGLRGAGRVDGCRVDADEEVLFHLADFAPAYLVGRAAFRELRPQFGRPLVDTEFFAQFAERRCTVILSVLKGAPGVAQKSPPSS